MRFVGARAEVLRSAPRHSGSQGENIEAFEFHGISFQNGAIPLDVLERNVDEWRNRK